MSARETWLTIPEIASLLNCDHRVIRKAIRKGELPASRLGTGAAIRVRKSDLDRWVRPYLTTV